MSYVGNSIDSTPEVLQNKSVLPRIVTIASGATITPTSDTADIYVVSALAADATIDPPSGTPIDGQKLLIKLTDDGTIRYLTWDNIYREVGVYLPTETVASKLYYIGCIYNTTDSKWDVIAVGEQV